jgi:hypothetical protein
MLKNINKTGIKKFKPRINLYGKDKSSILFQIIF